MTDDVDICNRALQMAGARDTITSQADGSNEANNCALLFETLRKQIQGMAPWNFNRKTINMALLKVSPGAPGSPVTSATQWTTGYPAPPWLYEYQYPSDCIQFRYLISQTNLNPTGVPIYSTPQYSYDSLYGNMPQRFIRATDLVWPSKTITGITQANPAVVTATAHGFSNGNSVYISGVIGMPNVNGFLYTIANVTANTFSIGIDSSTYATYSSGGTAVNQSGTQFQANVILTNAPNAIGTYSMDLGDSSFDLWDDQAIQAFVSALAGFLTVPLGGDKNLAKMNIDLANNHIIQARATDGNEGLTIQDTEAEWIAARDSYAGYGFSDNFYVAPYPPLFAIS